MALLVLAGQCLQVFVIWKSLYVLQSIAFHLLLPSARHTLFWWWVSVQFLLVEKFLRLGHL